MCAIKRLQDERSISAQVAVKEPEITGRSGDAASTGFSVSLNEQLSEPRVVLPESEQPGQGVRGPGGILVELTPLFPAHGDAIVAGSQDVFPRARISHKGQGSVEDGDGPGIAPLGQESEGFLCVVQAQRVSIPMSGDADLIRIIEEEQELPMSSSRTRVGVMGIRCRRSGASKQQNDHSSRGHCGHSETS